MGLLGVRPRRSGPRRDWASAGPARRPPVRVVGEEVRRWGVPSGVAGRPPEVSGIWTTSGTSGDSEPRRREESVGKGSVDGGDSLGEGVCEGEGSIECGDSMR